LLCRGPLYNPLGELVGIAGPFSLAYRHGSIIAQRKMLKPLVENQTDPLPKDCESGKLVNNTCPKHGSEPFGFAFACEHLVAGTGIGFNTDPSDREESAEGRPAAWCDNCEATRLKTGEYHTKRLCAACYEEMKGLAGQYSK